MQSNMKGETSNLESFAMCLKSRPFFDYRKFVPVNVPQIEYVEMYE